MKSRWLALGFCAVMAAPLCAQIDATDPVGYINVPIAGTGGTNTPAYTFLGLSMIREVAREGTLTAVGAYSLTDTNASWTDGQYNGANGTFTAEVGTTNSGGYRATITNTIASTKTLITSDNLSAYATAGQSYRILKEWTIASAFGISNSAGLLAGSSSSADQLLVWNGIGYDTYYFSSGGLAGKGWRSTTGGSAYKGDAPLFLEQGVLVRRLATSTTNLVVFGAVKITSTEIPMETNYNYVANVYPVDLTLGSSGLFTGNPLTGVASNVSSQADQVLVWNPGKGGFNTYFYSSGGLAGKGWRSTTGGGTDASTNTIPGGVFFLVNRKYPQPFMWGLPTHPVVP